MRKSRRNKRTKGTEDRRAVAVLLWQQGYKDTETQRQRMNDTRTVPEKDSSHCAYMLIRHGMNGENQRFFDKNFIRWLWQ